MSKRTKLLLIVLVFLPALPAWIGTTFPQVFGGDPKTVQAASALLSVMLFIGSLTVGWQIYQHHLNQHDGNGDEPPAQE